MTGVLLNKAVLRLKVKESSCFYMSLLKTCNLPRSATSFPALRFPKQSFHSFSCGDSTSRGGIQRCELALYPPWCSREQPDAGHGSPEHQHRSGCRDSWMGGAAS